MMMQMLGEQGRKGGRCPKLMPRQRAEILAMLADGRAGAEIARNFRVHRAPSAASPPRREPLPVGRADGPGSLSGCSHGALSRADCRKKRTLSKYQWIAAHTSAYTIQINRFSDRHFWHEGYDKANQGTRIPHSGAHRRRRGKARGRDERPQESRGLGAQIATAGSAVTAESPQRARAATLHEAARRGESARIAGWHRSRGAR